MTLSPALRRALPWVLLGVLVLAHGWLDVRRRARLDRGLSRHRTDFSVYVAASRALAQGEDPYEARSPRGWRYVYPPLLAVVLLPARDLPVQDAALGFYLLSVVALVLSFRGLASAIGPPSGRFAAAGAFLLAAPFLLQTLQRGQVTALLLWTQVGALVLLLRGHAARAGLLLALGVALRLTPIVPAAVVGLGLLLHATRQARFLPLRFAGGLAIGLALFFAAVPALALGPERATEVTRRWVESTKTVYAAGPEGAADLRRDYAIREHHFKNQSPRRVAAEWAARATDAPRVEGEPVLGERWKAVDGLAKGFAALVLVTLALLAWKRLDPSGAGGFRRAFALACLAPVFLGRYAWPTHYVAAIPFLAECLAGPRAFHAKAAGLFALATVAFYAGHGEALRLLPDLGVLLVGALASAVWFAARDLRSRPAPDATPAFDDPSALRHLHRTLRSGPGGLDAIAGLLPRSGLVVDLGAGEGLLAHALVRRSPGVRVLAVDHDESRLERLRRSASGLPIEAVRGRLEELDPPACDGIALVDVLHYLDAAEQESCLSRAFAALRPGGTLVVREPDAGAGLRFLWNRIHERVAVSTGFTRARIGRYRSTAEWEALLQSTGFHLERETPPPHGLYADRVLVAKRP